LSRTECIGCDERFVSLGSLDAHRRDATRVELAIDGWLRRRCLTTDEMEASGWERTEKGWRHPVAMRNAAKKASARGRQAA